MGNYRVRVSKARGTRYKKGTSSESNPTRSRHREAVRAQRNALLAGEAMLPVDERAEADPILEKLNFDSMSIGKGPSGSKSMVSEGGISALSAFTSCTNPTFEPVHRLWKSGSSMQAEVISVLAAMAELIKERGGTESDVEYLAALLVALEGASRDDPARLAAIAYLIHLTIKKVPKEILQAHFTKTVQIIYTKLLENAESEEGSILKNLLVSLGVVLRAQHSSVWQSANTRNMVVSICALCTHDRPWVRTMARRVSRAVLTDPVTALENGLHPAAAPVATYILGELEAALASNGVLVATRYLCLLEGVMHKVPGNLFKQLAETILRSFAVADPTVKCTALQCLQRALERQPCDAALSVETNVLLVQSLRSLAPPTNDLTVLAHWMQALTEVHACLSTKDAYEGLRVLPETTAIFISFFDVANEQLAQLTYQMLSRLIDSAIKDDEEAGKALLKGLDGALHVQSAPVWQFVVRTEMRVFESVGSGLVGEELAAALRTIANLRQSNNCFCKAELDFTMGSAIRHIGAGAVLSVIGLNLDPDAAVLPMDVPRSWLIPVLRVNIHKAPLSLFMRYFLPLAIKLYRRLPSLDPVVSRLYSTLQLQLWELLPQFLVDAPDFESAFPTLAPILGTAINERKDLRTVVLSSIRTAIRSAQQTEKVAVVERFAKNFMPLLFNLYTNGAADGYDDRGLRLSALETIKVYAMCTPADYMVRYIESGLEKAGEEADQNKQARILDVVAALLRNADLPSTVKVFDTVLPWLTTNSKPYLQKKAYRVLEEILRRRSNAMLDAFFVKYASEIESALLQPLEKIVPQARSAQLSAIRFAFESLKTPEEIRALAVAAIRSVVLLLDKENSTTTRANASKCVQELCGRLVDEGESASSSLSPIIQAVFDISTPQSGTSSVSLVAARSSLVALNIIVQKHIKSLDAAHTSRFVAHGCTWISDARHPVRVLAIRLIRMLVVKMPEFAVHQYRQLILSAFFSQDPTDATSRTRKANRLLLEVLLDRFGRPVVEKETERGEWLKMIRNIEKARRKRERAASEGNLEKQDSDDDYASSIGSAKTAGADTILQLLEDSDDEEEADEVETRSRVSSVWLREDDGRPTDLLDRRDMANKISTMDPKLIAKQKAKAMSNKERNGFSVSKDGKLLIDVDAIEGRKRRRRNSEDETIEVEKKRKVEEEEDDDDYEGDEGDREADNKTTTSGWRPGGKGIHRDTTKEGKKGGKGEKGEKGGKGRDAMQPYAYLPLKKAKNVKDLKKLVGRKKKAAGRSKLALK